MLAEIAIAVNVAGAFALAWAGNHYQKKSKRLEAENAKLKKFLGTVDTNNFLVRQLSKKNKDLTAALTFAKARLDRDFEREAVDKIASGEQH